MRGRRPDAHLVVDIPNSSRIMPYLMKGRNEAAVYFEQHIEVTKAEQFLADYNARSEVRATLFNLVIWAGVHTLREHPKMNRFVAGGRLWQRDGIWLTFVAKKRMELDAPLVPIKRRFDANETFDAVVRSMTAAVAEGRSDRKSSTDRELALLLRLPSPLLRALMRAARGADALGLLPKWFIDGDPLYTSAVFANLGSLQMDAGTHHLYEYGTASIFSVVGQVTPRPVVDGETIDIRRHATLRWSYDERIEDGMNAYHALQTMRRILEDPVAAGAAAPAPTNATSPAAGG